MTMMSQSRSSMHTRTAQSAPGAVAAAAQRRADRLPAVGAAVDPIKVLRQYLWVIIASGMIGGILGVAAYLVLQQVYPLFAGSVVFEVRPGLQKSSDVGTIDVANDDMVFRQAQTEAYILTSRDVLEAALKNPDVQNTDWGKSFVTNGVFDHANALKALEEEVSTSVRRSSNLFLLHWSAHKPTDVPVVLNAVATAYQQRAQRRDSSQYDFNLTLFRDQLAATQRELGNVEAEIKKLITDSNMTTLEDTRLSSQSYQMQELTKTSTELQTNLNMAASSLDLIRQQIQGRVQPSPEDRTDAEQDMSVLEFMQTVNYAKSQYRELMGTMQPGNARLRDAENRVKAMEAELEDKIQKIMLRNLQGKATEMENTVKRLENAVEQNQKELDSIGRTLQDLAGKQSELESLKSKREYLQQQRQSDMELVSEVTMMKLRKDASRVALTQAAFTPREPSFPRKQVIVPLGVLLLMALTIGVIFLRELMDKRVKSASDLATLPGARVLGSLPDTSDDPTRVATPELVVRKNPASILAESYRQVATAVLPELDQREAQTLLLAGGLPEAGTTTVATNLAAAAAATGRSVLLVDANFRRPGLGKAMGVSDEALGLGDVLSSGVSIDEAIHDCGDGVSVMPAGTPSNRVIERLNNGVIDGVLADLRSRFDLVIFDTPPAVVAGDALMLANKLDAAILVVRANQEHRGLVARMINRLGDTRCSLVGVLLNRPRNIAGGYLKKNYAAMAEYTRSGSAS